MKTLLFVAPFMAATSALAQVPTVEEDSNQPLRVAPVTKIITPGLYGNGDAPKKKRSPASVEAYERPRHSFSSWGEVMATDITSQAFSSRRTRFDSGRVPASVDAAASTSTNAATAASATAPVAQSAIQIKSYSGYPKLIGSLTYNPGYSGMKQTLAGTDTVEGREFNSSGMSLVDTSVGLQAEFTPRIVSEFNFDYRRMGVAAADLGDFQLQSSNASVTNVSAKGFYCFNSNAFQNRACVGGGLGLDSFPILNFPTNSTLAMDKLSNMTIGLAAKGSYQVTQTISSKAHLGWDYGLGMGASGLYKLNSSNKLTGGVGIDYSVARYAGLSIRSELGFERRAASFEHTTDSWTATNLVYLAKLGVAYEFGAK
ncbi:MAG: hypothetical protein JST16_12915 [Bdellovibrionales bacterium]|nr:hypothetical protein [Bdellovibrionales bacterium]